MWKLVIQSDRFLLVERYDNGLELLSAMQAWQVKADNGVTTYNVQIRLNGQLFIATVFSWLDDGDEPTIAKVYFAQLTGLPALPDEYGDQPAFTTQPTDEDPEKFEME